MKTMTVASDTCYVMLLWPCAAAASVGLHVDTTAYVECKLIQPLAANFK